MPIATPRAYPSPSPLSEFPLIASAWSRFFAHLADSILLVPVFFLIPLLAHHSVRQVLILQVIWGLFIVAYEVAFHARFGATPGKMLLGIRVVDDDHGPIDFGTAALRSLVHFILVLAQGFLILGLVFSLPAGQTFHHWSELAPYIHRPMLTVFNRIETLWGLSEVVTCLFNRRRKAVHDFIAGTLVVRRTVHMG